MWARKPHLDLWRPNVAGAPQIMDLASQLEDLMTHVLRCEKWARLDDRLDFEWRSQRHRRIGT